MTRRRSLTATLAFFALAIVLRKFLPESAAWIFAYLSFAAGFAFLTAFARGNTAKILCLCIMSVLLSFSVFETYLRLTDDQQQVQWIKAPIEVIRQERNMPELQPVRSNLIAHDPVLGIRHKPGKMKTGDKVMLGDELVFNAVYTFLESGWRITPQNPDAKYAIVFFGCSFTYGEGLDDEESIPYKLGNILGKDYQVFNFAYTGYGAHHMLAQIQNGFIDDIAKKYEKVVYFFLTIQGHAMRSAGYAVWDEHGPWYELENGQLVHKGRFPDKKRIFRPIDKFFRKSLAYKKLTAPKKSSQAAQDTLYMAIVAESDKKLREKSEAGLTVLVWPEAPYINALKENNVKIIDLRETFPNGTFSAEFQIPHDGHPNALATDIAAKALTEYAEKVIEDKPQAGPPTIEDIP